MKAIFIAGLLIAATPAFSEPVLDAAKAVTIGRAELSRRLGIKALVDPITATRDKDTWLVFTGEQERCEHSLTWWQRFRGVSCYVHGWIITIDAKDGHVSSFGHGQ
jgi:hypothetical protein